MAAKFVLIIKGTALVERYGVMMLAAALKRAGHRVELARAQRLGLEPLRQRVAELEPAALLYSAMTGEHQYLLDVNRRLKESYRGVSAFGGPHATFFPEMIYEQGVDVVCRGEGEEAVVEMADALAEGRDYAGVANLWVKRDGVVVRNDVRPLLEDLDALPFGDREVMYAGDADLRDHPTKIFFAMRGCVFRCTYCFNHRFNDMYRGLGHVCRARSVDSLLAEMKYVKARWPLRYMQIDDDTFLLHKRSWLEEFAERLPREVGVPFMCNVRADLLNADNLRLLKAAGCHAVWMGVECGDERLRRDFLKRPHTDEEIIAAVTLLRRHGIRVATQNLCGLPVEDPVAADEKTLALNVACRPDFAWSSIFYPYPRTELGERAVAGGYYDGSLDDVPETNKINTMLEWGDEWTKWRLENLHKFFGVVAEFPWLWPLVRRLVARKPNRLFVLVFFLWYGFCWKTRIEKIPLTPKIVFALFKTLIQYLRGVKEFAPAPGRAAAAEV
ncbi:MAG: radical SAM protein [candidate division Zixibacteria bacterium]|nr:radical SAM protein [candidate division Zixibacteria bacterium]